ncbi:MAG: efflux RND transporter periplasmic adaptor subunit [Bacteroidales bacterium]|nr:efflux RND transporter periplasmic adaptor subunit [Bacteroidales bacterium]
MKLKTIIISIVLIVVIGAMVIKLISNKKVVEERKGVQTEQAGIAVSVALAEMQETSSELNLLGTAMPNREVTVAAGTGGRIVQVNFKLGDFVSAGTVLARVDDVHKRLAFEAAQLNYDKYKDDYERFQVLREGDAVSEVQLRDMKMAYENAKIQLDNAKKQLDDTRIVAPFSGHVFSRNTELGEYVNVGSSIAGIADLSQLKVSLAVSENTVYQLKKGQLATVTTDIYPEMVYKGSISNISPRGNAVHTYPIEIMIPNDARKPLKAGTFVNITIQLGGKSESVLMIPRTAIVSSVKDPAVYVVKNNVARLTPIVTGRNHGTFLEIVSGLSAGDQVVIGGQINLSDGAKVAVL